MSTIYRHFGDGWQAPSPTDFGLLAKKTGLSKPELAPILGVLRVQVFKSIIRALEASHSIWALLWNDKGFSKPEEMTNNERNKTSKKCVSKGGPN